MRASVYQRTILHQTYIGTYTKTYTTKNKKGLYILPV